MPMVDRKIFLAPARWNILLSIGSPQVHQASHNQHENRMSTLHISIDLHNFVCNISCIYSMIRELIKKTYIQINNTRKKKSEKRTIKQNKKHKADDVFFLYRSSRQCR